MRKFLVTVSLFVCTTAFSQAFYKVRFLKINTQDTILSLNARHKPGDSVYVYTYHSLYASTLIEIPVKTKEYLRAVITAAPFYSYPDPNRFSFTNYYYDVTNKKERQFFSVVQSWKNYVAYKKSSKRIANQ